MLKLFSTSPAVVATASRSGGGGSNKPAEQRHGRGGVGPSWKPGCAQHLQRASAQHRCCCRGTGADPRTCSTLHPGDGMHKRRVARRLLLCRLQPVQQQAVAVGGELPPRLAATTKVSTGSNTHMQHTSEPLLLTQHAVRPA